MFRAHRGRKGGGFRAHRPLRHHAAIKVHAKRALRVQKVRRVRTRRPKTLKVRRYHSLLPKIPASYQRRTKRARYKPVRPPPAAITAAASTQARVAARRRR